MDLSGFPTIPDLPKPAASHFVRKGKKKPAEPIAEKATKPRAKKTAPLSDSGCTDAASSSQRIEIVLDERERDLYAALLPMANPSVRISKRVMPIGDAAVYRLPKTVAQTACELLQIYERKSVADLLSSIQDGRYKEQCFRMRNSVALPLHNMAYIVEGAVPSHPATKKVVYSAMTSLQFFKGMTVLRTGSVQETADLLMYTAAKMATELAKPGGGAFLSAGCTPPVTKGSDNATKGSDNATKGSDNATEGPDNATEGSTSVTQGSTSVTQGSTSVTQGSTSVTQGSTSVTGYVGNAVTAIKKDNITRDNIGEILLCNIPGISAVTAAAIMQRFGTFPALMHALCNDPTGPCFADIKNASGRRINSTCVDSLRTFLAPSDPN